MSSLIFKSVPGHWQGNDYKDKKAVIKDGQIVKPAEKHQVSMTSVSIDNQSPFALIFMTHMNIDFDGAANAYGPSDKDTLDWIDNAGRQTHYYGVMSVLPTAKNPVGTDGMITADDGTKVKVDPRYPDAKGYLPVVQQSGPFAGYFVSTTSKRNPAGSKSRYEQSYYVDSAAVPYSALSGGLHGQGVGDGNYGMAIRLDTFGTAGFQFLGGEGNASHAVGECSYKVFLDIGGKPKKRSESWVNNNFPTCFVVFPHSNVPAFLCTTFVQHSGDIAAFIALQAQVDKRSRGTSALAAFDKWVAGGRKETPKDYSAIAMALLKFGYVPNLIATLSAYNPF